MTASAMGESMTTVPYVSPDTTYFFAASIVRAKGSIHSAIHSGRSPFPANAKAHRLRQLELCVTKSLPAAAVRCRDWFGVTAPTCVHLLDQ